MDAIRYLRGIAPQLLLGILVDVLLAAMLMATGATRDVIVLACAIVVGGALIAGTCAYLCKRGFYRDLARAVSDDGHPLLATAAIRRPTFAEGAVTYDALTSISKAANDDVAAYRRQVEEYRAYIEAWVHEAKSPLAAAHLMLENLEAAPGDAPASDKLQALGDELRRVDALIDQALFYARSETLDRDYLIRAHALDKLVSTAIKASAPELIAAHITPVRRDLDYQVFTDEKWIAFILGQIIQNSVKYARAEGARVIEFTGRLVNEGCADESVELTVRDNGRGVSEADLPRVFDRGFTGDNGRTTKRSTGLGLYLVKRLCDKMGIEVAASSRQGAGFAVTLRFSTNMFQFVDRGATA